MCPPSLQGHRKSLHGLHNPGPKTFLKTPRTPADTALPRAHTNHCMDQGPQTPSLRLSLEPSLRFLWSPQCSLGHPKIFVNPHGHPRGHQETLLDSASPWASRVSLRPSWILRADQGVTPSPSWTLMVLGGVLPSPSWIANPPVLSGHPKTFVNPRGHPQGHRETLAGSASPRAPQVTQRPPRTAHPTARRPALPTSPRDPRGPS